MPSLSIRRHLSIAKTKHLRSDSMKASSVIIISLSIAAIGVIGHMAGVYRLPAWLTDNPIGYLENELEQ